jgi:hypothetical protein
VSRVVTVTDREMSRAASQTGRSANQGGEQGSQPDREVSRTVSKTGR